MTVEENLWRGGYPMDSPDQAKEGLEFADIGYARVSGEIAVAGTGDELLEYPEFGRLFLGG